MEEGGNTVAFIDCVGNTFEVLAKYHFRRKFRDIVKLLRFEIAGIELFLFWFVYISGKIYFFKGILCLSVDDVFLGFNILAVVGVYNGIRVIFVFLIKVFAQRYKLGLKIFFAFFRNLLAAYVVKVIYAFFDFVFIISVYFIYDEIVCREDREHHIHVMIMKCVSVEIACNPDRSEFCLNGN